MTTKESEVDVSDVFDDVANALANYSLEQKSRDKTGHSLTMATREEFRQARAAVAEVFEAASRVLSHRVGDLPNLGYIRDNDESRIAIAMFRTALRNAGEKV